ncbi:MAG: transglutaminase, partial [Flavobacterium sp.]|nr:transglutaminase [Flavobacterium sp.]
EGRLIRKDGSSTFARLIPSFLSKDNTLGLASIDTDGVVNGKIRTQHFDYNAFRYRDRYLNLSKESYIETLEKKYSNIEIEEYTVNNEKDLLKPVFEEYSFKHTGLTEIIVDKMYVSPLLYYSLTDNPFKLEKRDYPIDFVYPSEDKYTLTINIPQGYVVESLPKSQVFAADNNQLTYSFNIQATDTKIQLNAILSVNQSFITPNYYENLKNFFKTVVENQSDKIVLKKT